MPQVMLKRDWNGTFRRSIRNEKGEILRTLVFATGEIIDLTEEELIAVANDLGKALLPMEYSDERRKYVPIDLSTIDIKSMVEQAKSPRQSVGDKSVDEPNTNAQTSESTELAEEGNPGQTGGDSVQDSSDSGGDSADVGTADGSGTGEQQSTDGGVTSEGEESSSNEGSAEGAATEKPAEELAEQASAPAPARRRRN